jgi:anti-anti-sigma factor
VTVLEIHPLSGGAGFAVHGELDMSSADALLAHTEDMPDRCDLVFELSNLRFMDSSGLRAILEVVRRRAGPGTVVLRNPTQPVQRVLDLALPGGMPGLRVESNGVRDA